VLPSFPSDFLTGGFTTSCISASRLSATTLLPRESGSIACASTSNNSPRRD